MNPGRKIGTAGVDTGMLLIVDPAYLFSEEEWQEVINTRAKELGGHIKAVLQVLSERTGRDMERMAVVAKMSGDGDRQVIRTKDGVFIKD